MELFKHWKKDVPSSLVVFFVALPLCLGVALASGAPPFAGLIAGFVGGILVGYLSGSSIGVSGPAAGLVVIVLNKNHNTNSTQHPFDHGRGKIISDDTCPEHPQQNLK